MKVIRAAAVARELSAIWRYNARTYNPQHANDYEDSLVRDIDALEYEPTLGRPLEGHPGLRSLTLKRSLQGHGHIVIYRVDEAAQTIRVLHVYHTAQDWQGRLRRERPR